MPDSAWGSARRYVRETTGRYGRRRRACLCALQGLYFGLPWLSWNGAALVRFELAGLPLLALAAALALLVAGSLVGRAGCGYLCPHAAYGGLFQWVERRIEGGPAARKRLDQAAPTPRKLRLKLFKHGCFGLLSAAIGLTLVRYFTHPGAWEMACGGAYAALGYGNGAWMRQRFCGALCPLGRWQSALIGAATLAVRYDAGRGEPRGLRNRKNLARGAALGECRDCTLCVQVCPSGSDIRRGPQADCIGCAACIDACDAVMAQVGGAPGLVGYARLRDGAPRWRALLGAAALVLACAAAVFAARPG